MSIFQNKDIYDPSQGDPLKPIYDMLELLDKKVSEVKTNMKGLEGALKSVSRTGNGQEAKALTENISKLSKETEKLTALEKAEIRIKQQLEQANAKFQAIQQSQLGAYQKESALLNKLRLDYKNMVVQQGGATKESEKLRQKIVQLDSQLKKVDASVGQFGRNVGNYESHWKKLGNTLRNFFLTGGIIGGITLVLNKLKQFGQSSVNEAEEAAKAWGKVDQAIKSTGGAAGFTTDQLKKVADGLEEVTNIDADKIMNDVTAQLLTFTNITGDNFKQATETALNLNTVLGGDLKSNTIQLGKALNDPIKGISALRRVGVQFSADQEKVIKQLVKTGQVAKAQQVILAELEVEFGGQARRAAKEGLGGWDRLIVMFNNFKESIGNVIIPLINKLAVVIGDAFKSAIAWIKKSYAYIADFINGWIELYNESFAFRIIIETIGTSFTIVWKTIKLFFELLIDSLKGAGKLLGFVFNPKNWNADFAKNLNELMKKNKAEVLGDVYDYGAEIGKRFQDGLTSIAKGKKKLITIGEITGISGKTGGSGLKLGDLTGGQGKNGKNKQLGRLAELGTGGTLESLSRGILSTEVQSIKTINEIDAQAKKDMTDRLYGYYNEQQKLRAENLQLEREHQIAIREALGETLGSAAEAFGELLTNGELSYKEFGKFILKTALDVAENIILLSIAEIFAKEIAKKSFAGLVTAPILAGLVKGFFAGIKGRISKLAGGTENVSGAGTETSDSIPAMLSKNERVVPAHINKQLLGISNKNLPLLVSKGLQTMKMESLLNEISLNSRLSAEYLANGRSDWTENGFKAYREWRTGITNLKRND